MRLQDITIPSKDRLEALFSKYPESSMSVSKFGELLAEVGKLYRVPASHMIEIAEFEASYPHKPAMLKSSAYEGSATFRGPMQIGPDNWKDTKSYYSNLGINVPTSRTAATLAQQVAGVLLYIARYTNARGFEVLKNQPLDALSVYLIHNQGPGGAKAVFSQKAIPGWLKSNIRAQSVSVRGRIQQRYKISL